MAGKVPGARKPHLVLDAGRPVLLAAGDGALVVQWEDAIEPTVHERVLALWRSLRQRPIGGVIEMVPTFRSLLVQWDPVAGDPAVIRAAIERRIAALGRRQAARANQASEEGRDLSIPAVYGGAFGPDLGEVAERAGLSPGEVVRRHSAGEYLVYMLGFLPGFAYLGGLDPVLATPRRATPRLSVPSGSVGIGGAQTGLYGAGGVPGGWQIIGRTWLKLWDPGRSEPALLRPGDRVTFRAVSEAEAPPEWAEPAQLHGWESEIA